MNPNKIIPRFWPSAADNKQEDSRTVILPLMLVFFAVSMFGCFKVCVCGGGAIDRFGSSTCAKARQTKARNIFAKPVSVFRQNRRTSFFASSTTTSVAVKPKL